MMKNFWDDPTEWPRDAPGYVFLARAFDEIGRAFFGDKWPEREDSSQVKSVAVQRYDDLNELTEDELRELDQDDEDLTEDADTAIRLEIENEIIKRCSEGHLISAVRPVDGGEINELQKWMWNAENLIWRFKRCQMSLKAPFSTGLFDDAHWIYLTRESLDQYLIQQPYGRIPVESPMHLSPYVRFLIFLTKRMGITPENQPKKEQVIATIEQTWTGSKLSKNIREMMATLVREPESQGGRGKKKTS